MLLAAQERGERVIVTEEQLNNANQFAITVQTLDFDCIRLDLIERA
jgi:hypothetical protein